MLEEISPMDDIMTKLEEYGSSTESHDSLYLKHWDPNFKTAKILSDKLPGATL